MSRHRKACAAFKIFLNIKVTSLPKYKEETLQCSDKRRLGHESPALGAAWQFWTRARQELQQKAMPRCTLYYYIIIMDLKDMQGGSFSFPKVSHILASASAWQFLQAKSKLKLPLSGPILLLLLSTDCYNVSMPPILLSFPNFHPYEYLLNC